MNINSLGFKSQIRFVDDKIFHRHGPLFKIYVYGKKAGFPYTEKEIVTGEKGFTDVIRCCTAGGITDGKEVTIFHLSRKNENINEFEKIERVLTEKTGIKTGENHNFNGLIVGGKSEEIRKNTSAFNHMANCKALFDKIKNFFHSNNIDQSILWGHKKNNYESEIYYSAKKTTPAYKADTWFIRDRDSSFKEPADIKSFYETIKFSEKDKKDGIYINNRRLSEKEVAWLEQEPAAPKPKSKLSPFRLISHLC